jgi:hypothetical protein
VKPLLDIGAAAPAAEPAPRHGGAQIPRPGAAFHDALGRALAQGAPAPGANAAAMGTSAQQIAERADPEAAREREERPAARGSRRERGRAADRADADASAQPTPGAGAFEGGQRAAAEAAHAAHAHAHAASPADAQRAPSAAGKDGPRAHQAPQAAPLTRASAAAGPRIPASPRHAAAAQPKATAAAERERAKEREKEPSRRASDAPSTAPREATAAAAPQPAPAPERSAAPRAQPAAPAAPPLPPAPAGHDVQGAVLRQAAHLRVDAGALGALELHLRVRDGALHLRVDGEAARAVEARAGELSRALASEGLRLAAVEGPPSDGGSRAEGEGGRSAGERSEAWQDSREDRAAPQPQHPPQPRPARGGGRDGHERGIHVKA